jgi:hypothetical protein
MASKLPNQEDLTPDMLANPQAFMPNPNRLFAKRENKDDLERYRKERKRLKKLKKQKR